MNAGLPGAGLGAVLYTVLILMMPLFQLVGTKRTGARREGMLRIFLLLLGMIVLAWLESELAVWLGLMSPSRLVRMLPLLLLFIIFVLLEVVSWASRRRGSPLEQPPVLEDHGHVRVMPPPP